MNYAFAAAWGTLAAISWYLFLTRYWLHRACIDAALSSCVTDDGQNLTAGGMLWAGFGVVFTGLAIRALARAG